MITGLELSCVIQSGCHCGTLLSAAKVVTSSISLCCNIVAAESTGTVASLISAADGPCNLSGSTTGPAGAGGVMPDGVAEGLATTEALGVLTTADDVGLVTRLVGALVSVVDEVGVLEGVVDSNDVVSTATVASVGVAASVGVVGSVGVIASVESAGVTGIVGSLDADGSVDTCGGSSAKAGAMPADSAVTHIGATTKASTTAAPRHKPMRCRAFIAALPRHPAPLRAPHRRVRP
jgi:hypothetical protein